MRAALVLSLGLLAACSSAPTVPQAPEPSTASASAWPTSPGWHLLATLPGLQRAPRAVVGDRLGRSIAVLGGRGRRVVVLDEGHAPVTIKLPLDVDGTGVVWDQGALIVVDGAKGTQVRLSPADPSGAGTATSSIQDDRRHLVARPDGAVVRTDALGRADAAGSPAWRGVPGPSLTMVRVTESEAGPLLVVAEPQVERKRALLASIPKARMPSIIGLEPSLDPLVGWMAVWTGEPGAQALHIVRFDRDGRVLQTIPAPSGVVPGGLAVSLVGADQVVLGVPTKAGLQVHLLVPGGGTGAPRVER